MNSHLIAREPKNLAAVSERIETLETRANEHVFLREVQCTCAFPHRSWRPSLGIHVAVCGEIKRLALHLTHNLYIAGNRCPQIVFVPYCGRLQIKRSLICYQC